MLTSQIQQANKMLLRRNFQLNGLGNCKTNGRNWQKDLLNQTSKKVALVYHLKSISEETIMKGIAQWWKESLSGQNSNP